MQNYDSVLEKTTFLTKRVSFNQFYGKNIGCESKKTEILEKESTEFGDVFTVRRIEQT